jgi:hypothetical protein
MRAQLWLGIPVLITGEGRETKSSEVVRRIIVLLGELWAGWAHRQRTCHVYERETSESTYRKVMMCTARWVTGTWNDREI